MIVILDYGMGNLRSAQKGLERSGHEAVITEDPGAIADAEGLVLPGVGAFKDCYDGLCGRGFRAPLLDYARSGRPLLGICVGMQMLFDASEEGAGSEGLALLPGRVRRFPDAKETGLKVPHMGWNELEPVESNPCPLLQNLSARPFVYFVHSYYARPEHEEHIYATSTYGIRFPAVVGRDSVFGVQFHPEKSQEEGIGILSAFGEYVHAAARSARL